MKKIYMTLLACAVSASAWAYDFTSNGVAYNIVDSENLTLEVAPNTDANGKSLYGELVAIPATVEEGAIAYKVIRIGDGAFRNAEDLIVVEIAEGIEDIGDDAFSGCKLLGGVTLPSTIKKIGSNAFGGSGLANLTFKSEKCPEFPNTGVFPNVENLLIALPASGAEGYEASLAGMIDGKKQVSFENAGEMYFRFDDLRFSSMPENMNLEKEEINVDWETIVYSSEFDTGSVLYVPSGKGILLMRPFMCGGAGIGFRLDGESLPIYFSKCEDSIIDKLGEPYSYLGFDGILWVLDDVSENTVLDYLIVSGVEEIGAEADSTPEYFNMQGARISAPAEGQLLIEKRGGKSVKRIYR